LKRGPGEDREAQEVQGHLVQGGREDREVGRGCRKGVRDT
jgi:hypothetical protein